MPIASLLAFTFAAALLTVTPGLDTALVLRTAFASGARNGIVSRAGIALVNGRDRWRHLTRGLFTNLLNPKVGVFYVSLLPQFLAPHANVLQLTLAMTAIHAGLSLVWFALLCSVTRPIAGILRRATVVRWLDRITGGVFLTFGAKLALEPR